MSSRPQLSQDLSGVSTSTEGDIYVGTLRLYAKPLETLTEEDGDMVVFSS